MTQQERTTLRKLQDTILEHAKNKNIPDHFAISVDYPELTVGQLRNTIWPGYENIFRNILANLE